LSGMDKLPTAIDEAERAGFDLSVMDESLSHTYEERAVHHQRALDLALEMERAGQQLRERPQPTASAPVRR
jgi:conjugal transfer/entry exclusion protein